MTLDPSDDLRVLILEVAGKVLNWDLRAEVMVAFEAFVGVFCADFLS